MSDLKMDDRAPRSDLSNSMGKEITLFLREPDKFSSLKLSQGADGGCAGRLVGADRAGLWFEPQSLREAALTNLGSIPHIFFGWDDVLTLIRYQPADQFITKKEYRGLRPS